jgi:hypothetical protein
VQPNKWFQVARRFATTYRHDEWPQGVAASNAEIAKHETLIVEFDNQLSEDLPAARPEENHGEVSRNIISRN